MADSYTHLDVYKRQGRRQDKNARRAGFLTREIEQVLQRWQQIRRRFTGAGRR